MHALKSLTRDPARCFTFYDITRIARTLTDEEISHKQVSALVSDFLREGFMPNYSISMHKLDLSGKQITCQLIHTPFGDVQNYQPDATKQVVTNA